MPDTNGREVPVARAVDVCTLGWQLLCLLPRNQVTLSVCRAGDYSNRRLPFAAKAADLSRPDRYDCGRCEAFVLCRPPTQSVETQQTSAHLLQESDRSNPDYSCCL